MTSPERTEPQIRGTEWIWVIFSGLVLGDILLAVGAIVVTVLSWVFTWAYPIVCFLKKGCEL